MQQYTRKNKRQYQQKRMDKLEAALHVALTFWKHEDTAFNRHAYKNSKETLIEHREYKERAARSRSRTMKQKIKVKRVN